MSFINELKRRNVFRVAIAYVVVAWLIAQATALALDSFNAPGWAIKSVLFLLVIGFPLALVFAWAFELTPEGLRRDSVSGGEESAAKTDTRSLDRLIIVVLLLAVAYFSYDNFIRAPGVDSDTAGESTIRDVTSESAGKAVVGANTADPSIAVLPFVNMSDDPNNEYFAEGLSEELLNLLARIPELKVAARTSSFSYKGKDTQVAQIAGELNVAHVLEGSVRKSGDRVRITVQFINASNGYHVFSKTYDRTLVDIFTVQDEIAASVVQALRLTLLGEKPKMLVTDPDVFALYLKGRHFNNLKGKENWEYAIVALEEALDIDPNYAPAWSELSTTYRYQANTAMVDPIEGLRLARAAAEKALALDENLASAWASLSNIRILSDWDFAGAQEAMQRARQIDPQNADVLNGVGHVEVTLGRFDEAILMYEEAVILDPLNQSSVNSLGLAYINSGDFDNAEATFRQLLKLNPQYPWGHANIGTIMLLRGRPDDALAEIRRNPDNAFRTMMETIAVISLQDDDEADATVASFAAGLGQSAHFWMASVHSWRGNTDEAFQSLGQAIDARDVGVVYLLSSPFLENVKKDQRWDGILERVGLLDAYTAMLEREATTN